MNVAFEDFTLNRAIREKLFLRKFARELEKAADLCFRLSKITYLVSKFKN